MEEEAQLIPLTDSQKKLISKTEKAGELTPIVFAKKVVDFNKIKFLTKQDVGPSLGYIFQNIALLSGIKEPISEINKKDIKKMIIAHYSNMSLEEIMYAFELERYNKLPPKTEHFQLINAEYVSEVLSKYKKWLSKIRFDNHLPISKANQESVSKISDEEKNEILIKGCIRCFDEWKVSGTIQDGNTHIYDYLFDDIKIHEFSIQEKEASIKLAKQKLADVSKTLDRKNAKSILKNIKNNKSKPVVNQAKRLLLCSYFGGLGNKDISEVINKHLKII